MYADIFRYAIAWQNVTWKFISFLERFIFSVFSSMLKNKNLAHKCKYILAPTKRVNFALLPIAFLFCHCYSGSNLVFSMHLSLIFFFNFGILLPILAGKIDAFIIIIVVINDIGRNRARGHCIYLVYPIFNDGMNPRKKCVKKLGTPMRKTKFFKKS